MTKAAIKAGGCRDDKCPCQDECPLNRVLDAIGGKWKVAILCALHTDGGMRYNSLKRKIKGITNTMLAGSLRELGEAGLVNRVQYEEMPVRVEYTATEAVHGLAPILRQLAVWGLEELP